MTKHLYLMRHGQTLFNVRRKIQGSCDSPLTPLGIEQAKKAKELLSDIQFDHYYSSTQERSSDTLEVIIGENTSYKRLKGIKERGFGTFESESEDLNPPYEKYDEFFPIYGGETSIQVAERMSKTLKEVMDQEDHQTVLAVSHAGACMCFFSTVADRELLRKAGGMTNCAICHYEYENGKFKFIELLKPNI